MVFAKSIEYKMDKEKFDKGMKVAEGLLEFPILNNLGLFLWGTIFSALSCLLLSGIYYKLLDGYFELVVVISFFIIALNRADHYFSSVPAVLTIPGMLILLHYVSTAVGFDSPFLKISLIFLYGLLWIKIGYHLLKFLVPKFEKYKIVRRDGKPMRKKNGRS